MLFCACDSSDSDSDSYRYEVTETRLWSGEDLNEMTVTTVNGNLSFFAIFGETITAEITKSCEGYDQIDAIEHIDDVVITDSSIGEHLFLEAEIPDSSKRQYGADFDITGPGSLHLELVTVNGSIEVNSMISGATIQVVNGNIGMEHIEGSVSGQSVNGNVDCQYDVLNTGKAINLQTTNGNVILTLPADISAAFNASTAIGIVTISGFSNINYTTNEINHKSGTIGTGSAAINVSTAIGNITIQAL